MSKTLVHLGVPGYASACGMRRPLVADNATEDYASVECSRCQVTLKFSLLRRDTFIKEGKIAEANQATAKLPKYAQRNHY